MLNALNVNVNVSRARRDHEMAPSSCASSWMEAISADPTDTLGDPNERPFAEPEREGCLEVASAAWLLLPGRYTIGAIEGRIHGLRWPHSVAPLRIGTVNQRG